MCRRAPAGLITALLMLLSGCVVEEDPGLPPLPSLTPSPLAGLAQAATLAPTPLPSPTGPPTLFTPTPPLGATSTPLPGEPTAILQGLGAVQPPLIDYFVATPQEGAAGDSVQLFWATQGGTSAAVYRLNLDRTPGRTWAVDLDGSLDVTLRPSAAGRDEIYVLSVTNGLFTTEQQVAVAVACTGGWFFAPPPEKGCPISEPRTTGAVTQVFEAGRMFRLDDGARIIVLYDTPADSISAANPAWQAFSDPFTEGQPADDPAIVPPEGRLQPVRGLGLAWRNQPGVRARLGWATGSEIGYQAVIQEAAYDEETQLYFTDDLGAVITLLPDGSGWGVVGFLE